MSFVPLCSAAGVLLTLSALAATASDTRWHSTDAIAPTIVATATMSVARFAHTATTLQDGRVLVLGGFTDERQRDSAAELYDPSTDRFLPLPPMVHLRQSHSATVLPDGKVLIAGGYAAGSTTLSAAEIFDPTTRTFSPTGPMNSARAGHIAVLLKSGKVLVAGGVGPGWDFLSSAELYDPATGRFTATGSMTVARESHTAVRLEDGGVLVVGGHRGRRASITLYASAEVYDPTTNRFRRVGDMHTRRHKHDAVLLRDGRVFVTGGTDERDSRGVYDSSELYDPKRETFQPGPTLQRPRYKHAGSAVQLPSGVVLIAGGARQAETFDPETGRLAVVAGTAPLAGQFSAVSVMHDGRVLITGGYGASISPLSSAWVYRP